MGNIEAIDDVKQIIIIRKDLNMRKGKMVAQGSHASLGAILNFMEPTDTNVLELDMNQHSALAHWVHGKFKKICVYVNSETEMTDLYKQAKKLGLITCLITDSGLTEFNGVPTITALAIGPAFSHELHPITGHLPLL